MTGEQTAAQTATGGVSNPQARDGSLTASELWRAVKEDRILSLYHPQVELSTGRAVAVETLARIVEERGKLIAPACFIAEAEASGVIVPLGRTVLRQACESLAEWRAVNLGVRRICFNVSASQLALDPTLPRYAQRSAADFGLQLDDVEFEIAERELLDAPSLALATIEELLDLGGRLVIDDFRARHQTITQLAALDASAVKLDPSIVSRLAFRRRILPVGSIVRRLIRMGLLVEDLERSRSPRRGRPSGGRKS